MFVSNKYLKEFYLSTFHEVSLSVHDSVSFYASSLIHSSFCLEMLVSENIRANLRGILPRNEANKNSRNLRISAIFVRTLVCLYPRKALVYMLRW